MNIILCGNSKYLIFVLKGFLKAHFKIHSIITNYTSKQPKNSTDLAKFCKKKNIVCHLTSNINSKKTYQFIKKSNPDYLFFSWHKIVKKKIFDLAKYGSIGSHPSILPANRGRHPLHWAKVMGIKNSGISFFFLNDKVDDGKIIYKAYFKIFDKDDINSLEDKVNILAEKGCYLIAKRINNYALIQHNQKKKSANYLRKRNQSDLIINLKMNFKSIDQLVKSYVYPYDGAILIIKNKILRVSKIDKIKNNFMRNFEIGKIFKISNTSVITRCIDSPIKIFFYKEVNLDNIKSKYIYDPSFYICRSKKLQNFFKIN